MAHDRSGMKTPKGIEMLEHVRSISKALPEVVELIDVHIRERDRHR